MWIYYFCYCEAAFAAGSIGDLQLVLTRPGPRAPAEPDQALTDRPPR
jgi:hypothetical protein